MAKAKKKEASPAKVLASARRDTFTKQAKAPLKMPVAVSTKKPIRPESMKPRAWIDRTLHKD